MKGFKIVALFLAALSIGAGVFGQKSAARISYSESVDPSTVLTDAYNAYAAADYKSAVFLFRKALSDARNKSEGAVYMLVMAGMNTGDYKAAYADAEFFLESFPQSEYVPLVEYQKARSLFLLGDYDKALIELGDFCHEYPDNMMYASALFWIGECFFAGYNFDEAKSFYERILADFSDDPKAVDAKYRLDAINSYSRQEKLLYMLQQTGENYLASKEVYEKTLRRYELEDLLGVRGKAVSESEYDRADYPTTIVNVMEDVAPPPAAESSGQKVYDQQTYQQHDYRNTLPQDEYRYTAPSRNSPEWENMLDALLKLKISAAEAQTLLDNEVKK